MRGLPSIEGVDLDDTDSLLRLLNRLDTFLRGAPNEIDAMYELPEHWRYFRPVLTYGGGVDGGGHHAYFWNNTNTYGPQVERLFQLVSDGLIYYGATDFVDNWQNSLVLYRTSDYAGDVSQSLDGFWNNNIDWDPLDKVFYYNRPSLRELMLAKVNEQIPLFTAEPEAATSPRSSGAPSLAERLRQKREEQAEPPT